LTRQCAQQLEEGITRTISNAEPSVSLIDLTPVGVSDAVYDSIPAATKRGDLPSHAAAICASCVVPPGMSLMPSSVTIGSLLTKLTTLCRVVIKHDAE